MREEIVDGIRVTYGSGNVFADLGLPNAEERLIKGTLMIRLRRLIEERGLSDAAAADVLGTDAATVDRLFRGGPGEFSLEGLLAFLTRFGQDVEIRVGPSADGAARVRVV